MKQKCYIEGFYERIEEAIYEAGLTKASVADQIGCNRKSLYTPYENRMLSSGYLAKLCSITNVSADWLLGLSKIKRRKV